MNPFLASMLINGLLAAAVVYLRLQLWLARRDVRLLR